MKKLSIACLFSLLIFAISCSEEDEPSGPTITVNVTDFTGSIDENSPNGTVIGTVSATTNEGSVTFEITSQTPNGAVAINASSGELTVADASLFVAATNPTISGTITARNGEVSSEGSFTITVNEVTTEPTFDIFTGEKITFTKADGADPGEEANQDRITDNVWITRGNNGGQIYNASTENAATKETSPADTEWALGTTTQGIENLTFADFRTTITPKDVVGVDLVLHLITDDVYIDIKFTHWSTGKVGGFAYERSSR